MPITEKTRKARVTRWKVKKAVWETKLASAKNQNDTDVAKLMIGEAEDALSRLKEKGEDVVYPTPEVSKSPKKTKRDTDKYPLKINESIDDKNTIGS